MKDLGIETQITLKHIVLGYKIRGGSSGGGGGGGGGRGGRTRRARPPKIGKNMIFFA